METSLPKLNGMIGRQVDVGAKPMFYTLAMPQAKKHVHPCWILQTTCEEQEVELWFLRSERKLNLAQFVLSSSRGINAFFGMWNIHN